MSPSSNDVSMEPSTTSTVQNSQAPSLRRAPSASSTIGSQRTTGPRPRRASHHQTRDGGAATGQEGAEREGGLMGLLDRAEDHDFRWSQSRVQGGSEEKRSFAAESKNEIGTTGLWGRFPLCRGMYRDVRARLPFYASDWVDGVANYRVVPATAMIFFANVLPGLAFSLDLIETTGMYGVQEVLLSTFMAAFVASFLGGQPLLISGVTGPITVFNKTIYDIFEKGSGDDKPNYLYFVGWVYLWGAILHWIAAVTNAVSFLRYVTRFSCDTFGFYVSVIYLQYGIQVVTRQFTQSSDASGLLGIILALLMTIIPHLFNLIFKSTFCHRHVRRFAADYGMPLTLIATSGLAYWGRFDRYVLESGMTLPTNSAFTPANDRAWLVPFWKLEAKYVGIAFPFGLVLFILFYFDANVSALMAQGSEFPLKKPAAFHWDFMLLGITTFIAGLLGIPAPNGLIPQAPTHTKSLVILGPSAKKDEEAMTEGMQRDKMPESSDSSVQSFAQEVPVAVVEQRVSNLAQGALCLVLMTGPFEHVLGLIPKGVLAGLFWYMGSDALLGSGVTALALYLLRDRHLTSLSDPLHRVRKSRIWAWFIIQLLGFGATFAITQTIASIGFPVIISLLIPFRTLVIPRLGLFTEDELNVLDGPVASPFTMRSLQ